MKCKLLKPINFLLTKLPKKKHAFDKPLCSNYFATKNLMNYNANQRRFQLLLLMAETLQALNFHLQQFHEKTSKLKRETIFITKNPKALPRSWIHVAKRFQHVTSWDVCVRLAYMNHRMKKRNSQIKDFHKAPKVSSTCGIIFTFPNFPLIAKTRAK